MTGLTLEMLRDADDSLSDDDCWTKAFLILPAPVAKDRDHVDFVRRLFPDCELRGEDGRLLDK